MVKYKKTKADQMVDNIDNTFTKVHSEYDQQVIKRITLRLEMLAELRTRAKMTKPNKAKQLINFYCI